MMRRKEVQVRGLKSAPEREKETLLYGRLSRPSRFHSIVEDFPTRAFLPKSTDPAKYPFRDYPRGPRGKR